MSNRYEVFLYDPEVRGPRAPVARAKTKETIGSGSRPEGALPFTEEDSVAKRNGKDGDPKH